MDRVSIPIGRFFSLQRGQVGQYLSTRVLVVRTPFQPAMGDICYFGFDRLNQAQKFAQSLADFGCTFQLRSSQVMPQRYEVRLAGHSDLARTLAYWERREQPQRANPQPAPAVVFAAASPVAA